MKLNLIIILFTIFLMGCATAGKRLESKYIFDEEVSDIKESIVNGNSPQAVQNLSMLLEMDPKNEDARSLRALAYQKQEQYEKAAQDYLLILRDYPVNGKAHYNLAMIYAFKVLDRRAALEHFDNFLTLDIRNPKAFPVAKIMCALESGREAADPTKSFFADWSLKMASKEEREEAREGMLMGAIRLDPEGAGAYLAMAKELEGNGDYAGAMKYYKKTIDVSPTSYEAHYRMGQILLSESKKEEAEIHLTKASLFNPSGR